MCRYNKEVWVEQKQQDLPKSKGLGIHSDRKVGNLVREELAPYH